MNIITLAYPIFFILMFVLISMSVGGFICNCCCLLYVGSFTVDHLRAILLIGSAINAVTFN